MTIPVERKPISWRHLGYYVEKLTREAGIDTAEVLEIEHGPHCRPVPVVVKLAGVFGVPSRRLRDLAGLVQNANPRIREEVIRFAARSESPAKLTEREP